MKKKWKPQRIVDIPHQISDKEMQQRLAELAELLYIKLRQLHGSHSQATCSEPEKERTGRKYA